MNFNTVKLTQPLYDRANMPTRAFIESKREHHRIATLGRNKLIYDYHKTNFLSTGQVERVTRVLPRPKRSLISRLIGLFRNNTINR